MVGRPLAWLLWAMVAASCTRTTTTRAPGPETAPTKPPAKPDPQLLAVADAVDPGPQKPLLTALPGPLRGMLEAALGATTDREVATREIREALMNWDKLGTAGEQLPMRLLALGRGLVLAERAVAAGDSDAELLLALSRVYSILDLPIFTMQQGIFQQVLQTAAKLAQSGASKPGEIDLVALMAALKDMFERAGPLHRRTAAELLRKHGDHPEVPRVLGRLADDALRRDQYAQAVAWRQMAVARLGAKVTASEQLELARTCYRALELACGDAALARGRDFTGDEKAKAEHEKKLTWTEKTAKQARRAVALAGESQPSLTTGLERGHLMIDLDRNADAEALFVGLKAKYPEDARPYGGLAKLAVQRGGDFKAAAQQVALGKPLANKDREFYEVALGTVGVNFFYEALPQIAEGKQDVQAMATLMLTDLRGYAEGLRAFDPARAAVVELIVREVQTAMPALVSGDGTEALQTLRTLPAQVGPMAVKFPDSPDVRRLVLLAANFATDAETALAAVRAPLSPALAKDAALQLARASAWLDLALAWEKAEEMPAMVTAIADLRPVAGDHALTALQAAALALRFNGQSDKAAGEQAAELYAKLAREGPTELRAAALNNLGVLRAELGDPQKAIEHLSEALAQDDKAKTALLNLAALVLSVEGGQRTELNDAFAIVARDGMTATLRVQAEAWRHVQAQRGAGDVEQTRADFVAALAKERKSEFRGNLPLGRWGLLSSGSFQVSFFYSTTQGFEIRNALATTVWLFLPAPGLDVLLAEAQRKPGKAGKSDKAGKPGEPRKAGKPGEPRKAGKPGEPRKAGKPVSPRKAG